MSSSSSIVASSSVPLRPPPHRYSPPLRRRCPIIRAAFLFGTHPRHRSSASLLPPRQKCIPGGEVGIVDRMPACLQHAAPAGMVDALLDDVDDDDVEPDLIADDSGDEIAGSNPAGAGGGSSSGTQQYPPHFLSLDLDAMRQEGVLGEPIGFGARDAQGIGGVTEFQVGQ
ncbi:hypothetical protein Ahy_B03g063159 [Arachis hypogaea]|uniref:Uncharacterized protein n=1 Tax=Arachis hypogaea TaxID=3818 RepID=A0A444ZWD2_ARAHY|nr:hypothetical protein Ahy_B03g063159 [Arachis hypogaea]